MKKSVFISIIITTLVIGAVAWFYVEDTEQQIYDKGYEKGYKKGYTKGSIESYEEGYDRGYTIGYQEGTDKNTGDLGYLTTDNAPPGTVWTTPSGEKYHEGWCHYISGKYNLTYFLNANEATNHGYTPCSVCH